MTERMRVAVLAGGPSAEHEVSIQSAQAVLDALPKERYDPVLVVIDRQGRWSLDLRKGVVDVVFPVMHGPFGEDGVVQGHLETLGLPYVGCGVLASAVAMDKTAMRRAFAGRGHPDHSARLVHRARVEHHDRPMGPGQVARLADVRQAGQPGLLHRHLPRHLHGELHAGVELAFGYDRVVVVEQGIVARELTCGVLGDYDTPEVSAAVELNLRGDWLDYESKYLSDYEIATVPAELPERIAEEVRELSLRAYRAIDGYGLARVDFFYQERTGRLHVLEINTMPGFTPRSVYARGWEASGVSYPELLGRLIDLGLARSAA